MAEMLNVELLLEGVKYGGGEKLLLLLINHIADHMEVLTPDDVRSIVDVMFEQLSEHEDGDRSIINLCLVVLSNLTVPEKNTRIFCEHTITMTADGSMPPEPSKELHTLLKAFLQHNPQEEDSALNYYPKSGFSSDMVRFDPWAYVGSIITNICRDESARRALLRQSSGYIPLLTKQMHSFNPIRRRSAVSVIRTCVFDKEVHWWLLEEVNILTPMLLLCVVGVGDHFDGKETVKIDPFTDDEKKGMDPRLWMVTVSPSKTFESEIDILQMILESIVLLCQTRQIRALLFKKKVFPILRNLDLAQLDPKISDLINEIVQFLYRDEEEVEGPSTDIKDEGEGEGEVAKETTSPAAATATANVSDAGTVAVAGDDDDADAMGLD